MAILPLLNVGLSEDRAMDKGVINTKSATDTAESLYEYISENCNSELIKKYSDFYNDFIIWLKMKEIVISKSKKNISGILENIYSDFNSE